MRLELIENEPALILRGRIRYLVVADLHLGLVRFYDEFVVRRIEEIAEKMRVDEIVILGDLKHRIGYDWRVQKMVENLDFTLVKGNHDGGLKGEREIHIGKFHLIHGHVKPKEVGKNLIAAHSHPSINLNGLKERVWVFGRWRNSKVLVIPAFNEMCSSTPVNLRVPAGFLFRDLRDVKFLTLDLVMIKDPTSQSSQQPPSQFQHP